LKNLILVRLLIASSVCRAEAITLEDVKYISRAIYCN